jgi:hypothetical protein
MAGVPANAKWIEASNALYRRSKRKGLTIASSVAQSPQYVVSAVSLCHYPITVRRGCTKRVTVLADVDPQPATHTLRLNRYEPVVICTIQDAGIDHVCS